MTTRLAPGIGDPVVVDGTKYRIRALEGDLAHVRTTFGGQATTVDARSLQWDGLAGVWRPYSGPAFVWQSQGDGEQAHAFPVAPRRGWTRSACERVRWTVLWQVDTAKPRCQACVTATRETVA